MCEKAAWGITPYRETHEIAYIRPRDNHAHMESGKPMNQASYGAGCITSKAFHTRNAASLHIDYGNSCSGLQDNRERWQSVRAS